MSRATRTEEISLSGKDLWRVDKSVGKRFIRASQAWRRFVRASCVVASRELYRCTSGTYRRIRTARRACRESPHKRGGVCITYLATQAPQLPAVSEYFDYHYRNAGHPNPPH